MKKIYRKINSKFTEKEIEEIYKSYWGAIKEYINTAPTGANFNLANLGKLFFNAKKYNKVHETKED